MTLVQAATGQVRAGLRERKKVQTRDRLIAAALKLCDEQGFEATTVDQISDAADISPRTFNRYFATKEDVVLAPVEDMIVAMTDSLDAQPRTGNEIEALINAQVQILGGRCPVGAVDLSRFETMNRIIQNAPSVNARSMELGDRKLRSITDKIAERMEVPADDARVRVIVSVYMSLMHISLDTWRCGQAGSMTDSTVAADTLKATYQTFREVAKNL
ncbi:MULTISPECIES: TetR family transcriptional regulator [Actinomycetes]|uniref:TetR family transcriptional regulator n=1 Tax=Actinomycetes TaxID=1760 RepID=UPI0018CC7707|nr:MULTISPECIES: TetR family transcriptional regulator [Actinomycetes]